MESLPPLNKEVDVDFLVFVERHAGDLLKWDILTFFGRHPNDCVSLSQLAKRLHRSVLAIRPELGDLVLAGILERLPEATETSIFCLTQQTGFRQLTIKFAKLQANN